MLLTETDTELGRFLERVAELIAARLAPVAALTGLGDLANLQGGKMLRSRLAGRLLLAGGGGAEPELVQRAAAAVEMVHTASLCHDDVIDSAVLRRNAPSLWRRTGASAAVLIGDILLCEAMNLLLEIRNHSLLTAFMSSVNQVCQTEARQELVYRGRQIDVATCLELAEGKTGALFAFAAGAAAPADTDSAAALSLAGLRLGTAYQLADDLIDVVGSEAEVGKTLGTDGQREKYTLPQIETGGVDAAVGHVRRLCAEAIEAVGECQAAREAIEEYLARDMGSVLGLIGQSLGNQAE